MNGDAQAMSDLLGPGLPPYTERAWEVFNALSATRGAGAHGPLGITHAEIRAYQQNLRTRLTPMDIQLVREADSAFMAEIADRMASAAPVATPPALGVE